MHHEVRNRHVAREDEGHWSGEKPNQNEKAPNKLKDALNT